MQIADLEAPDGMWTDALSGESYRAEAGRLSLTVPPVWGAVLRPASP